MIHGIPKKAPGVKTPWWTRQSTGQPAINDGRHYVPVTGKIDREGNVDVPVECPVLGCGWCKAVRLEGYGG
jgi:hypothetical protein